MSQFILCKSNSNLKKFGGRLLNLKEKNDIFFWHVLSNTESKHYIKNYDDIWVIQNMDVYCCKQLNPDEFFNSKLYFILNNLYDLCEWMVLWYGNEYEDLDEVFTKDGFINYVQCCMEEACHELYVRVTCK